MLQFEQADFYKKRLKGLLALLCTYWTIMVLFTIVSVIIGQSNYMPGDIKKFLLNALTIESSYNGAWWYIFAYVVFIIASPLILRWVKGRSIFIVLGIGFAVYCIAYYIRFKLGYSNWILGKLGPFGMTAFEYVLGALAAKNKVFTRLGNMFKIVPKWIAYVAVIVIIGLMLYARTKIVPSLFVAPISGFVIMTFFHFWSKPIFVKEFFLLVGKHSTNIWLTHMFFYMYLFKNLVYVARYPLLIYILMLAITIPLSMIIKLIERPFQKQIAKI